MAFQTGLLWAYMSEATTEPQYLKYDGPSYTNDEWLRRTVPIF
jgi:hypothetical protein